MDDLISRKQAIEALGEEPIVWNDGEDELAERNQWERDKEAIESVPSAQPKKGRWIWNKNGMDWGLGAWVCSECCLKPETWWESDRRYNPLLCSGGSFCGNCGADMRGKNG